MLLKPKIKKRNGNAMSAPQRIQPSFEDEISIVDIIHFFQSQKKLIATCLAIGGIIGSLYGHFTGSFYKGSVLISNATISGNFVVDPKVTLAKLKMNSFYSKETFLSCNPAFYEDKDIDFVMSDIVKSTITKNNELIELSMAHKDKKVIRNCLENIINDIGQDQSLIAQPLLELKKIELDLAKEKLKATEEFGVKLKLKLKLNEKQIKELKINESSLATNFLHINILMLNASEIKQLNDQINIIKTDLSSFKTKPVEKVLPINIEKSYFPSTKLGLLLGLFLGFILSIFIYLVKRIKP
jgi:hypothetical protein